MHEHRLAEDRSLAYHAVIARRLRDDPAIIETARQRVSGWVASGDVHPHYAHAWQRALAAPLEDLLGVLVGEDEEARALRQVSPFAGVLDARERWRIWREVREQGAGA